MVSIVNTPQHHNNLKVLLLLLWCCVVSIELGEGWHLWATVRKTDFSDPESDYNLYLYWKPAMQAFSLQ